MKPESSHPNSEARRPKQVRISLHLERSQSEDAPMNCESPAVYIHTKMRMPQKRLAHTSRIAATRGCPASRRSNLFELSGLVRTIVAALLAFPIAVMAAGAIPAPGTTLPPVRGERVITTADVTVERVGTSIPASAMGEPVGGVTLSPPRWVEATDSAVAYALVDGSIAPKDPKGKPINIRVLLPASWSRRAIQMGGGGINGFVPMMRGERPGSPTATFARYGSDSGHQMGGGRGAPGSPPMGGGAGDDWALNEEAIRNFGYMQMKKTHDDAMVIMERVYGERPRFNYYNGDGQSVASFQIPNAFDRTALITGWVERDEAPGKTLVVNAGGRSLPLCSYPNYPRYKGGPPESADSYESAAPLDLPTP
jgi:hypothetical protein